MSKPGVNLPKIDVDRLFREHTVAELVEIGRHLDTEIEKSRLALLSMVGDRYKDVLAASDEIKDMKLISEEMVAAIKKVADGCELLLEDRVWQVGRPKTVARYTSDERSVLIQIRVLMVLNEEIWSALDKYDHLLAAELCLFAEHIFTGLSLMKEEFKKKYFVLFRVRETTDFLRSRILKKVKEKLQSVTLTSEELGNNLGSLVLLENQNTSALLDTFVEHRKIALSTVISSSHPSVRVQISSMVHCLIATVHLLHDCFISSENSDKGLIWKQLDKIVGENAPCTLSKVQLPTTPLTMFIPDIVRDFRPKCLSIGEMHKDSIKRVISEWLQVTMELVQNGLKSLEVVTNLKGLHIIRVEALKIDIPNNWKSICTQTNLPENFNIWYYYFQEPVSKRAENLVVKKVAENIDSLHKQLMDKIKDIKTLQTELTFSLWNEEASGLNQKNIASTDLKMKTNGFSQSILKLCEKHDESFLELLKDIYYYLYGKEYEGSSVILLKSPQTEIKFVDRERLENTLRMSCNEHCDRFTSSIEDFLKQETNSNDLVTKSLFCARLLQGLTFLCPNFQKCSSFNGVTAEWTKICNSFNKCDLKLWRNWIKNCNYRIDIAAASLDKIEHCDMLHLLPRWETIEIQEQTEDRVFKSQIKLPSHPSLPLYDLLTQLNSEVNSIFPHTLPKQIHMEFIESCIERILTHYEILSKESLHQTQALQFLFDVKFVTTLCVPRENSHLMGKSQSLCDGFRAKVDPFDLDVFYGYLQGNVQKCIFQSQMLLGCLIPSSAQLASIGVPEKNKEQEKDPSVLALSKPSTNSWFPLLPISAPVQKSSAASQQRENKFQSVVAKVQKTQSKRQEATSVRSGAAALFSGLTNDWFS